jgi:hypothetical protein
MNRIKGAPKRRKKKMLMVSPPYTGGGRRTPTGGANPERGGVEEAEAKRGDRENSRPKGGTQTAPPRGILPARVTGAGNRPMAIGRWWGYFGS